MTPLEILKAARELISDPARWCTGELAKDADGMPAYGPSSDSACRWCAEGAVLKCGKGYGAFYILSEAALDLGVNPCIADVNDGPDGHARVLAIYDHAIARLEAEAARAG